MIRTLSALIILLLCGCSPDQRKAPKNEQLPKERAVPVVEQPLPADIFGKWQVVRHYEPGISAMDKTQADAWIGRSAYYEQKQSMFEMEACTNVSYEIRWLESDEFFNEFRVELKSIGIAGSKVSIVDVNCDGSNWTAPGSLLVVKDKGTVLTLWDGVFFELSR